MDDSEWVIDTWVLYQVSNFNFVAYHFLTSVLLKPQHKLATDNEGKIEKEYKKCFANPQSEFQRAWWIHTKWIARKVVSYSGKLYNAHTNYLIERLRFHNDNLPFVGVASKTRERFLVAEESDYTTEVREYLKNKLQIQVMSVEEADNCTP